LGAGQRVGLGERLRAEVWVRVWDWVRVGLGWGWASHHSCDAVV
jgi:hypothetical protein